MKIAEKFKNILKTENIFRENSAIPQIKAKDYIIDKNETASSPIPKISPSKSNRLFNIMKGI